MGIFLAVCASAGLLASFSLLHETFQVYKNPTYVASCNISPLISCQSAMSAPESEILGLPFATFGVAGFVALLVFSVLLATGTAFRPWVWKAGLVAATAGLGSAVYLYVVSITSIGSICPWCFLTWVSTIAIFWGVVTHVLASEHLNMPKRLKPVARVWLDYAPMILAGLYALLVFSIVLRFQEALL
jgi:uncharacterized membrane protein